VKPDPNPCFVVVLELIEGSQDCFLESECLMETLSMIGMILSVSGVGMIVFSKRRKLVEGGRQSTIIEHPWVFAGGILLTILGGLAQVVAAYL
jgi:hypothetical protein